MNNGSMKMSNMFKGFIWPTSVVKSVESSNVMPPTTRSGLFEPVIVDNSLMDKSLTVTNAIDATSATDGKDSSQLSWDSEAMAIWFASHGDTFKPVLSTSEWLLWLVRR